MVLNVTEEQKKIIESQGYMVVEFKLWCKKLSEHFEEYLQRVIDSMKAVMLFLQDMMFRAFASVKEISGRILEELRPIIDRLEPEYDYEPRRKYQFVRSLGRKYEVNYSRVTIYHRCRDRC